MAWLCLGLNLMLHKCPCGGAGRGPAEGCSSFTINPLPVCLRPPSCGSHPEFCESGWRHTSTRCRFIYFSDRVFPHGRLSLGPPTSTRIPSSSARRHAPPHLTSRLRWGPANFSAWAGLRTAILPVSASLVAGITGVSHHTWLKNKNHLIKLEQGCKAGWLVKGFSHSAKLWLQPSSIPSLPETAEAPVLSLPLGCLHSLFLCIPCSASLTGKRLGVFNRSPDAQDGPGPGGQRRPRHTEATMGGLSLSGSLYRRSRKLRPPLASSRGKPLLSPGQCGEAAPPLKWSFTPTPVSSRKG
jgi:hypothetical protein